MFYADSVLEPGKVADKLRSRDWKKEFDSQDIMTREDAGSRISDRQMLERMKNAVNDVPETEGERAVFKEAALQTCRDIISFKRITEAAAKSDPDKENLLTYYKDLQNEVAANVLREKSVQDIRNELAEQYTILKKEKNGWFLSKTNSKEYDDMMKQMRIFNAKLDMMSGKKPSEELTDEEYKTAQSTGADVLLANAKQGLYNYGTMKTKNGRGSIWHTAGSKRFDSSMRSLQKLGELGNKLHISNTAAVLRDETQLQVLQNRGNSKWIRENIADAFAKSICVQVTLNRRTPDVQQNKRLQGDALQQEVENIKKHPAFQNMLKNAGPEKMADAVIKGGSSLFEVYNRAAQTAAKEGHVQQANEISPEMVEPKRDTKGLVSGYQP